MMDAGVIPGFLLAVLIILVTPGPDMAFMIATGSSLGRGAAVRAALGVTTGVLVWVTITASGLGIVLAAEPAAVNTIRVLGALYLAYLGVRTFQHAGQAVAAAGAVSRVFWRGFIVNMTNPKIALFFIAFLPQFLGSATAPAAQLFMLGVLLQLTGLVVDIAVGCAAGAVRRIVLERRAVRLAIDLAAGAIYSTLTLLLLVDTILVR